MNILTNHALNLGRITIFGGEQMRPNIHINDMVDLYLMLLDLSDEAIAGKTYNAGHDNQKVAEIAEIVRDVVQQKVSENNGIEVVTSKSDDRRSYCISSEKIKRELGFVAKRTIEDAVRDLVSAFQTGKISNPMTDIRYYNIKTMQAVNLR